MQKEKGNKKVLSDINLTNHEKSLKFCSCYFNQLHHYLHLSHKLFIKQNINTKDIFSTMSCMFKKNPTWLIYTMPNMVEEKNGASDDSR